ncbi:hypothetical protein MACK_000879 [Theileria orientalis]|uniref:Hexose transporter 1 n=1 Tax=Theileria orientalis TaxID=68886 RepID=A0A976QSF8_THEOR|nr:hypothetical protein MACK_000879 [Theileria orientalis]
MAPKISPLLLSGVAIASLAALNFGLSSVSFNISKEFAIVDLGWCLNESSLYDCDKSQLYAGLANGSTFIGAAIGSLLIGFFGKLGRRISLMVINWLFIVGSIIAMASVNFGMLFVGRLISGMGIGLSAIAPVFLVEICNPDTRGAFAVIYPLFITFGQLLSTGWQLLHMRIVDNLDEFGKPFTLNTMDKFIWRTAQGLPIICSVICLILVHFVFKFDTPCELIAAGKTEEARDLISKLHDLTLVDKIYNEFDRDQEVAKTTPNIPFLKAIKNRKYRKPIVHSFVLAALQQLTGITILTSNVAELFANFMGRTYKSTVMCSLINIINFICTIVLSLIINKYGRKTLLTYGMAVSTMFCTLAAFSKPIGKQASWVGVTTAVGSFGFVLGFALSMGGVTWVYLSEVYANEYKNGAYSIAVFINWLCASISLIVSEFLISYSEVLVNIILFGFCIFNLFYVIFFIKETKGVPPGKAYD